MVRAWLVAQGFRSAEIRREKGFHDIGGFSMHPLARGCYKGELNVCKWLYDNGAAEDITNTDDDDKTPMHWACYGGHLSVCQWLFEVGAAGDITKTSNCGVTPMHRACNGGHLSVCQWLVLNSALNDPTSEQVDEAIVQGAVRRMSNDTQSKLLSWARDMIDTHDTFLNVFLRASVILPASQQDVHPSARCLLPCLHRAVLERVSWFVGVEVGRRVRNAREFKEALDE